MGYVQQQQSQQEEQREAATTTTTSSTQINCAHYKRKIVASLSLSLSLLTALPDATRNYEMCTCVCVYICTPCCCCICGFAAYRAGHICTVFYGSSALSNWHVV